MADFSLTTFSSKGKLLQIEYALNAVAKGETAIGIKAKNGVVLAVEKKSSSILVDDSSFHKIELLSNGIGATYAGIGPDFRVITKKARKFVQQHYMKFMDEILVSSLCRETAQIFQEYTQSGGVRPFGISSLVCGFDEDGPQLYQLDPSGAYYEWKACAIGKNMKNAKTFLEKRYNPNAELEDAIHTAILALKDGFEGLMTSTNIEIGVVGSDQKFKLLQPNEIKDYLEEVE